MFYGEQTDSSKFGVICVKIKARRVFLILIGLLQWKFCFCVCAPFCPYNFKTITSINLKFGGKVFYGEPMDSSKFGVICVKIKARREFFLFLIGNTQ